MLSSVFLNFTDSDLLKVYQREKIEFFKKIMPIISVMAILISSIFEIVFRVLKFGQLPFFVSIINWGFCLIFIFISFMHSRWQWLHAIVCPMLTIIIFLYLSFLDYDQTVGSVYYALIVGFSISQFFLVIFNESWSVSTFFFAPCLSWYMYRTGFDLLGSEILELILRCVFCIMLYGIVAYRIEMLTKQSFLGRESSEKAFHRWMKIFETFPEGIALIRHNYILYANRSLKYILNVGINVSNEEDPLYEQLKVELKQSEVEQWIKNEAELKKLGQDRPKLMNVWHFLIYNEKGAIFRLLPKNKDEKPKNFEGILSKEQLQNGEENEFGDIVDQYLAEIPKYITLNQVNVKIAGTTDKLLVVRDVTSIVMNENIMDTKRSMAKLTDILMRNIETHSTITEQKLQKLDQYVTFLGSQLNDESINELKKMQFRIKDFQQVYFISENKFRYQSESTNVKKCFQDIENMIKGDCKQRNIEFELSINQNLPENISCDKNKLKQVLLNLIIQDINNQFRGLIKIEVQLKSSPENKRQMVQVLIQNSKSDIKQKDYLRLLKLSKEKDFAKILDSKCDLNFKIAKIISNAIGWEIDFNGYKQGKINFLIPFKQYIGQQEAESRELAAQNSNLKLLEEQKEIEVEEQIQMVVIQAQQEAEVLQEVEKTLESQDIQQNEESKIIEQPELQNSVKDVQSELTPLPEIKQEETFQKDEVSVNQIEQANENGPQIEEKPAQQEIEVPKQEVKPEVKEIEEQKKEEKPAPKEEQKKNVQVKQQLKKQVTLKKEVVKPSEKHQAIEQEMNLQKQQAQDKMKEQDDKMKKIQEQIAAQAKAVEMAKKQISSTWKPGK